MTMRSAGPHCRASSPADITTTAATTLLFAALASFPTANYDEHYGSMWSLVEPSRIYAQRAGWYIAQATMDWPDATGTTDNRTLAILKNGTSFCTQNRVLSSSSSPANYTAAALVYLEVGDYLTVQVSKTAAGTVTPTFGSLAMAWVAPADGDGVIVSRSTTQSINNVTATNISFDAADKATGATMWSSGATVTVPSDGWYIVSGSAGWDTASASLGRRLWIDASGTGNNQCNRISSHGTTAATLEHNVCAAVYIASGGTVKLTVDQNSGANRNVIAGSRLAVVRVPNITDGVALSRTTTQTSGAVRPVQFTSELRDDGGMADIVADNTKITIQQRGVYLVTGYIHAGTSNVSHKVADIHESGTNILGYNSIPSPSAHNDPSLAAFFLGFLEQGKTLQLRYNPGSSNSSILAARFQVLRIPDPA